MIEVAITEKYEFTLEATFVTNVPAPVVVICKSQISVLTDRSTYQREH